MKIAKPRLWTCVVIVVSGLIALANCSKTEPPKMVDVGANPDLAAHTAEFKQEVIKVTDGVYVAAASLVASAPVPAESQAGRLRLL